MTVAKTDTAKLKDNIVRLFTSDDDDVPETSMSRLRETGGQIPEAPPQTATSVDLTDRHKLVMTFGAGRSGKTMLQRWVVERANIQRPDEPLTLVTLDAARATMKLFFQDVLAPGTVDGAMPYLERILTRVQKSPRSMVLDFPADMTLVPLARQIPDLNEQIEQAEMSVVALYLLTPRQTDLTVLDAMENVGFKPAATALILNLGTMDTSRDPTTEYATLRRNSAYRAAIERGAVEIWMPRHWAAKPIEDRLLSLHRARDETDLNIFDRSRAFHWLREMEAAFAPIRSWLP
jgi:hypothetical protein